MRIARTIWLAACLLAAAWTVFAGQDARAKSLYIDDSAAPASAGPGVEFEVAVNVDMEYDTLKSYSIPVFYDRTALEFMSARSGSDQELAAPIAADGYYYGYIETQDQSNYAQSCSSTGLITLMYLKFRILPEAAPGYGAYIYVGDSVELIDCYNEDQTQSLPPWPWDGATVLVAGPPIGSYGVNNFMDLDGDAAPDETDAETLRKIVYNLVGTNELGLLSVNARNCDVNGNAVADAYDVGRFDALIRPVRTIHSGDDGLCQSQAQGDDVQDVEVGNGLPNSLGVGPGFNCVIDTSPSGDDVLSGNRVLTGLNGVCETVAQGDDEQIIPYQAGSPRGPCVSPGPDQTLSTGTSVDDQMVEDPKTYLDMLDFAPAKGNPYYMELIEPGSTVYMSSPRPTPITVAIYDENGKPKTGLSPIFSVENTSGAFLDGSSTGTTYLSNVESDSYQGPEAKAEGQITVMFLPGTANNGLNVVQIYLPGDSSKDIPDLGPLYATFKVFDQPERHPTHLAISAPFPSVNVGEETELILTLTDGSYPVHGMADRIKLTSRRNVLAGQDLAKFGDRRVTTLALEDFENQSFGGFLNYPVSGELAIDSDKAGYFGHYAVRATHETGGGPYMEASYNTSGYDEIHVSYQWAFQQNLSLPVFDAPFIVQYSDNGSNWRVLRKADSYEDYQGGNGKWISESFNLSNIEGVNDNVLYLRFLFNVGAGDGYPQSIFVDNVGIYGVKTIFEEDFESYSANYFPGDTLMLMNFVNSGADGILDTTPLASDDALFGQGYGKPNSTIIIGGLNGVIDTMSANDDVGGGFAVTSGPDGVADTYAQGDDFQVIGYGEGEPFARAIAPGSDQALDSTSVLGDDQLVGSLGSRPRIEVVSDVYPSIGPGLGANGSDKFLFIGREYDGSTIETYSAGVQADLAGYDQVELEFYILCPNQADAGVPSQVPPVPAQETAVEVSDNGGHSWVRVWDNEGSNSATWSRHEIVLQDDGRFNLTDDLLIRWVATMDGAESGPDPDGVYLDNIKIKAVDPLPDRFGPVVDTLDYNGTYKVKMKSSLAGSAEVSAIYWPEVVDHSLGDAPVFGSSVASVLVNQLKADPHTTKLIPSSFEFKACESKEFMVVGALTTTPTGRVEDLTEYYDLKVVGPARQTAPGVVTADCFLGDDKVDIFIFAEPNVEGLYDPGGGGSGSQTGDVSGRVYKPTFAGAGDAPIWLDIGGGDVIYSHTDSQGFLFFGDVPAGSGYTIKSSLEGYTQNSKTITVNAGSNTSTSIILQSGANFDGDALSDSLDTDKDNDGVTDSAESGEGSSNYDPDTDGDGRPDSSDDFPNDPDEWLDTDGDGTGDNSDTDDDDDGISDSEESVPGTDGYVTDPLDPDTDGGGEEDGSEVSGSRDPTDDSDDSGGDSDSDGLIDDYETDTGTYVGPQNTGSDPYDSDSDDDGLTDGAEVNTHETDPNEADTDSDGVFDDVETSGCMDPNLADTDGDGLNDGVEDGDTDGVVDSGETDPCDADSDDDGIPDGYEVQHGLSVLANDAAGDLDGDSLTNLAEYGSGTSADDADSDDDGMGDGWEVKASSCGLDPLAGDSSSDADADGLKNLYEYVLGADPCDHDTDGDGFCDGDTATYDGDTVLCVAGEDMDDDGVRDSDETDATKADTDGDGLCDGDTSVYDGSTLICSRGEDLDRDKTVDPTETDPTVYDTDEDGLSDGVEYGRSTDPRDCDSDDDGLCDGDASVYDGSTLICSSGEDLDGDGAVDPGETDPMDPDTDDDGLNDGEESNYGADPLDWDTDDDEIPDYYEALNYGRTTDPLDPLDPSDGLTADFDSDGNPNCHEYWNGTDLWTENVDGGTGCFCWADSGSTVSADGIISPLDVSALSSRVSLKSVSYTGILPNNGDSQELDMDEIISPLDLSVLKQMVALQTTAGNPSIPVEIELVGSSTISAQVGFTCRITVGVLNASSNYTAAMGVIFELDGDSSTGDAVILGGEGGAGEGRYDVSGAIASGGRSSVVLRIESAGTIFVDARLPGCGSGGKGRYSPGVAKARVATVTAD